MDSAMRRTESASNIFKAWSGSAAGRLGSLQAMNLGSVEEGWR
jgi:hypothetical protein